MRSPSDENGKLYLHVLGLAGQDAQGRRPGGGRDGHAHYQAQAAASFQQELLEFLEDDESDRQTDSERHDRLRLTTMSL